MWERNGRREAGEMEIEVMSALSQFGITVKARFVGALRKGICNVPPLVCTAVYNSFLTHLLSPFCFFSPFSMKSLYRLIFYASFVRFYWNSIVETTQITVCFRCVSVVLSGLALL